MPNKNGTGPEEKGSKTGRGLGNCGGGATESNGQGRDQGMGQGRGMGMRRRVNTSQYNS
ncbi:MAG: DUF5320 family protein [Patescibacteria group bacterium]|jgi:hypothetical protein|nr:DUF5320 family protein [Patescibacteria group bacterium]